MYLFTKQLKTVKNGLKTTLGGKMTSKYYTLKDLATIKYGKNQKDVASAEGAYPIYGTGGLMGYATKFLYNKPSVLIGRKGTIDKVRYIDSPFWTVDTLFYTEINTQKIIPKYLFYLMSTVDLNQYNEGTTIPSLRTETLNRLEFNIHDMNTQRKIAKILSAIDDKIELNNKINANLEEQALEIYKKQVLNAGNAIKNGSIGDYCSVKSGFAFKSAWWKDSGIKVIKIKNIEDSGINFNDCSCVTEDKISLASDFTVQGGDILIAMTGATIGKFAIVPKTNETLLVNQRVGKFFIGEKPLLRLPFLYCTLKQQEIITEIINRGQGSAQPNISGSDIMTIPCIIPKKELIEQFNKNCCPLFEKIITNKYENGKLQHLRNILLPKLMNGEINVEKIQP